MLLWTVRQLLVKVILIIHEITLELLLLVVLLALVISLASKQEEQQESAVYLIVEKKISGVMFGHGKMVEIAIIATKEFFIGQTITLLMIRVLLLISPQDLTFLEKVVMFQLLVIHFTGISCLLLVKLKVTLLTLLETISIRTAVTPE